MLILKYYLDKVCIRILQSEKNIKLSRDEEKAIEKLKINVQKSFPIVQNNLYNCNIMGL